MTDQETPEGGALPLDANASPETKPADAETEAKGSEADSSPAAKVPGDKSQATIEGLTLKNKELTRRMREAERRAERMMNAYDERVRATQQQQQTPTVEADKPRALKDFGYDETKYAEYLIERAASKAAEAAKQKAERESEETKSRARREAWEERFESFAEQHPEILDGWDSVPISQGMGLALQGSEVGPEVGLYLKNNRDVAKQLSKLDPYDAAREIGRIEERLVQERKKAAQKPVSQAPPPPPNLAASGESSQRVSTLSPESDRMSDEEWVRAEQARLNRKRKRAAAD